MTEPLHCCTPSVTLRDWISTNPVTTTARPTEDPPTQSQAIALRDSYTKQYPIPGLIVRAKRRETDLIVNELSLVPQVQKIVAWLADRAMTRLREHHDTMRVALVAMLDGGSITDPYQLIDSRWLNQHPMLAGELYATFAVEVSDERLMQLDSCIHVADDEWWNGYRGTIVRMALATYMDLANVYLTTWLRGMLASRIAASQPKRRG